MRCAQIILALSKEVRNALRIPTPSFDFAVHAMANVHVRISVGTRVLEEHGQRVVVPWRLRGGHSGHDKTEAAAVLELVLEPEQILPDFDPLGPSLPALQYKVQDEGQDEPGRS
jgi:hypothetical protein